MRGIKEIMALGHQNSRCKLGKSREELIHEKKFSGAVGLGLLQYLCRRFRIYQHKN